MINYYSSTTTLTEPAQCFSANHNTVVIEKESTAVNAIFTEWMWSMYVKDESDVNPNSFVFDLPVACACRWEAPVEVVAL